MAAWHTIDSTLPARCPTGFAWRYEEAADDTSERVALEGFTESTSITLDTWYLRTVERRRTLARSVSVTIGAQADGNTINFPPRT